MAGDAGSNSLYTGRGKAKKLKTKKALKGTTARIPFLGGLARRTPKVNVGAPGTRKRSTVKGPIRAARTRGKKTKK